MNVELMKRMMDACYLAQRVRGMLPTLPEGVTPSYIHYLDGEAGGPGEDIGYQRCAGSAETRRDTDGEGDGGKGISEKGCLFQRRSCHLSLSYRSRQGTVSYLQRTVFYHSRLFYGRYPGRRCEMYDPHHRCSTSDYV